MTLIFKYEDDDNLKKFIFMSTSSYLTNFFAYGLSNIAEYNNTQNNTNSNNSLSLLQSTEANSVIDIYDYFGYLNLGLYNKFLYDEFKTFGFLLFSTIKHYFNHDISNSFKIKGVAYNLNNSNITRDIFYGDSNLSTLLSSGGNYGNRFIDPRLYIKSIFKFSDLDVSPIDYQKTFICYADKVIES